MSIHVSSMAWKFSLSNSSYKQKSNIKLVLVKLCDNASDEGYCWPSMSRIAKECELSRRSVIDQIAKLKELGLVRVTHRYKESEQTSNGYQINLELLSRGELLAPPSENHSPHGCITCTQNRHLTINEPSHNNVESVRRSRDERLTEKAEVVTRQSDRLFADQLPIEHQHCKTAMQILQELKSDYPQIYDGSQAIEQWDLCELTLEWLAVSQYADNFTSFNAMLHVLLESLLQLRFSASNDNSVGLPKLMCVNAGDETLENIIEHEQILEV